MQQIKHWNNIENATLNSKNNSNNGINNITSNDDSGGINKYSNIRDLKAQAIDTNKICQ